MGRPTKASKKSIEPPTAQDPQPDGQHSEESTTCPHCQALLARIAELETSAATRATESSSAAAESSLSLPSVEFKALRLIPHGWGEGWQLRPAPARRYWMDELPHAYKCLPLLVANQWGWQILSPTDVVVTWNGSEAPAGLRIDVHPQYESVVKSQFGAGIVTFSPPWLFRTPPGWNLFLKGPTNRWKPNCVPLEGVIETWWLNYTFTINWKLVQPGTVVFRQGESLGQLLPVPHLTFQDASAIEAPIGLLEPEAAEELLKWQEKRRLIAAQKDNVHHLYRKAEGVDEHFVRVSVPPLRIIDTEEAVRMKQSGEQNQPADEGST
jgi:hypothetical protein